LPTPTSDFTLTLLHTNDVRGRVMPLNKYESECTLLDGSDPSSTLSLANSDKGCHGGVAARTHYVKTARAASGSDNTLLVDAGNYYFGSLWYAAYKGLSDIPYVTNLGYDVMGAGSNEFFSGSTEYFNFLKDQLPSVVTVVTNLDISGDPINNCVKSGQVKCVKPYDVVVKGGRKIGVLGFVPTDLFFIATPGPLLSLYPYMTAATNALAALNEAHPDCDIVIAVSMLNENENVKLATEVAGIDVIVSGNHIVREAGDDDFPYPEILAGPTGDPVHIVSAGHFGGRIGHHSVTFNTDGVISGFDADVSNSIKLTLGSDPDTNLYLPDSGDGYYYDVPAVDSYNTWDKVREEYVYLQTNFKNVVQGSTTQDLDGSKEVGIESIGRAMAAPPDLSEAEKALGWTTDADEFMSVCAWDTDTETYSEANCCYESGSCFAGEEWFSVYGCRHSDCPMGRFANNAILMECKDCQMAISNGGSIRGSLSGEITKGDLINVFPYQNTLATFNMKGIDFRAILEFSVAGYTPNDGDGKFMQVGGFQFAWNPLAPDNEKIISVEVCDNWDRTMSESNPLAGSCAGSYKTLEAQSYYKIATNNYIRGGGDGFDFSKATNINDFGEQLEVVLQKYTGAISPITPLYTFEEDACTGEINDFKLRWSDGMTGRPGSQVECGPACQDCRVYKTTGETDLTCPVTIDSQLFCNSYSGAFVQALEAPELCNGKACSGFGQCNNATLQCECKQVEVSDFQDAPADLVISSGSGVDVCGAGFSMFKGAACHEEREKWSFGAAPIVYILAVVNIFFSLFAIYWFWANGKYAIIRLSQPTFHMISASGGFVSAIGSILLLPDNNSTIMCGLSLCVTGAGMMLLYGAIFAKTHRIDALMNNKRLKRVRVSNMDIGLRILGFVAVELLAIIALLAIAPVTPTVTPFENKWMYSITCGAGEKTEMWVMVLCIIQFGMLGYGCYLAYRIRNVKGGMGEAFYIGISLYSSFLIGIIAVFVLLNSLDNLDLVYMLGPSVINICCIVSVASTLMPKVLSLTAEMKGLTGEQAMKLGDTSTATGTAGGTSTNAAQQQHHDTPEEFFADVSVDAMAEAVKEASPETLDQWKELCKIVMDA
jgi:2',3'-cyclic-nucleotide 2'-phosphodiesterase (5'-nucleotidase family)